MDKNRGYKDFLLKAGYWAAIVLIILALIKYLLGPLTPFIIAFAVAALLQPVVRWIVNKFKIKRSVIAAIAVVLLYLIFAGLVVLISVGIISALVSWASGLPTYFTENISPWLADEGSEFTKLIARYAPELKDIVGQMLPDIASTISSTVMDFSVAIVSWATNVGTKLPSAMLAAVICVIATIFTTADYSRVVGTMMKILPPKARTAVHTAKKAFLVIIGRYLRSYMLILLITFAEIFVGLLLIGFENAAIIALAIAVFDILPIVGSGMVLLPWTIVTFIQGNTGAGIGLAVLYVVVIVVRQVIEPKIVGKQVGLHPLLTLLCMWLGLKLFGGVGMFVLPISLLIILDLKASGIINFKRELQPSVSEGTEIT